MIAGRDECTLRFIGTATMLLRFGPVTLLTDPNFLHRGQFAYLGKGLVSKRLTEPALEIADLPALDAVVLSHLHGDHWDRVARQGLPRTTPVITTPHAARRLHRQGFATTALTTWQDDTMHRDGHTVTVTAAPGRHATGPVRRLLPPVMGSIVDHRAPDGSGLRVYITGDTMFVDDLLEIPVRFPDIDVAVLHLGGTRLPGGALVTMDAAQGTALLEAMRPTRAVPIHNDDYGVFKSPLSAFLAETKARGVAELVRVVTPGETLDLNAVIGR